MNYNKQCPDMGIIGIAPATKLKLAAWSPEIQPLKNGRSTH